MAYLVPPEAPVNPCHLHSSVRVADMKVRCLKCGGWRLVNITDAHGRKVQAALAKRVFKVRVDEEVARRKAAGE